jgi:DNA-binding FadR family transcriptional regulator
MPKTIRELADEFGVSKQAIRKKLDANFRTNYVQTVTRNGVQTLVVANSGYLLLKQHFIGDNNQKQEGVTFTSNTGNTIELLTQQLAIKDSQIKEKDEQLKSMQKLLDQSQQLQLMAEKKIEKFKGIASKQSKHGNPTLNNVNDLKQKNNVWWHFW